MHDIAEELRRLPDAWLILLMIAAFYGSFK